MSVLRPQKEEQPSGKVRLQKGRLGQQEDSVW